MDNLKQVRALYLEDNRQQHSAVIIKTGSGEINKALYNWIQLSETIFHPKGGGQPSDEGSIAGIPVAYVHKEISDKNHLGKFEIYHCFDKDQPFNFKVGDEVELEINASSRSLHSRLHTAGHVLAESINRCFPELVAYQGNHYPNNSYVKFKTHSIEIEKDKIKETVEKEIRQWVDQDLKVFDRLEPSGLRTVKVLQNWSPCGGTHVKSIKEIVGMEITDISINKKEGTLTVKYLL